MGSSNDLWTVLQRYKPADVINNHGKALSILVFLLTITSFSLGVVVGIGLTLR